MKYNLTLISIFMFVAACTTQPKSKVEVISGEFLFYDNAAVLNTGSEIYGVVVDDKLNELYAQALTCLLYTSPSPRDLSTSRMPSSA